MSPSQVNADYLGQEFGFSAGKHEGKEVSSETIGDTEWKPQQHSKGEIRLNAGESRTNKSLLTY